MTSEQSASKGRAGGSGMSYGAGALSQTIDPDLGADRGRQPIFSHGVSIEPTAGHPRDWPPTSSTSTTADLERRRRCLQSGVAISDVAAGTIELTGVIKWFDIGKGYGFIVPDNGMPDVLLHASCLQRDGFPVAREGVRVVVEVLRRRRGLQAFRVLSMHELPTKQTSRGSMIATGGLQHAEVKWFNRLRGFGFLTTGADTPDIFVHIETLRRSGLIELRPGQPVLVRFGPGSKGLIAAEVQPDGAGLGSASS
jgi:cold shock protein